MDHPATRLVIELSALGAVAGTLAQYLPPTAAAVAIIWYAVQIWQSETGKNWRSRWLRLVLHRPLAFEDKVCFVFLGLAGSGVAMGMWALMRITQ